MIKRILGIEKITAGQIFKNLLTIIVGSLITSIGINAFLVPHKFLSGGVSGLSQLMSYLTPLSVGTYLLLFNIPIFILGIKYVSRAFVFGSFIGTLTLSGALYATAWMSGMGWAPEMLLSAIIGGALSGGGTGLVFRIGSSHGGTDIVAAAARRRWSMSVGSVVFSFNILIAILLAYFFGLHAALYSLVSQFCSAVALDKVMLGFNRSRAIFIITSEPQKIANQITTKLSRGVTFLDGEGAYLGNKKKVIYCVVSLRQLARVRHYVKSVDPDAFMTVAEVSEVMGRGFKAVPV